MTVLVHFSGPSYSKTAVLEPGAVPVDVGRDPKAAIYLPDSDRLISRRHITLEWDPGGAKATVLSKVNGLTTPHGDFALGQSVVLAPGDTAQLGRYSFLVERTRAPEVTALDATSSGAPLGQASADVAPAPAASAGTVPGPTSPGAAATAVAGVTFDLEAFAAAAPQPAMPPPEPAPPAPGGNPADPWGDFASEWVPAAPPRRNAPIAPSAAAPLTRAYDDAFSSSTAWRVEDMADPSFAPLSSTSFEHDKLVGAAFSVPGMPEAPPAAVPDRGSEIALRALCRGLGVPAPAQLQEHEWEQLGQSVRQIVQGISDLMNVRDEMKRKMRATDRTLLGGQDHNPLKDGMPLDEMLHYLLFTPRGGAGYMPVKRALDESIADLRAHELASLVAVRAAVEGAIRDFEPVKLRATLMTGKRSLTTMWDNARLWDLYTAHYEQKVERIGDWLEQLFNRHFMPAYSRETDRLRREAQAREGGRAAPDSKV